MASAGNTRGLDADQLDASERHGELVDGVERYSAAVRAELLSMAAATIDQYLKPAKTTDQIRGVSTTKQSPLLRSSITIRKSTDQVEPSPGFFEGDTVAHCGPTLKGEFARTLNLTDVHTGSVFTRTVRNNAHTHILSALKTGVAENPFEVTGLDFDNGSEFLNKAVIAWAADMEIFFARSRPYKKNDQATIESKNNHLVRKYQYSFDALSRLTTADQTAGGTDARSYGYEPTATAPAKPSTAVATPTPTTARIRPPAPGTPTTPTVTAPPPPSPPR